MIAEATRLTIVCAVTGESKETEANADGSAKLPRAWRRHEGKTYSPQGWASLYVPRAMRLPVASVALESLPDDREGGWKAFWAALRSAWGEATRYANLCLASFAARDFAVPLVGSEKGPRLPKIEGETANRWRREVYALHHDFPALDATSAAAISLECWRTWNASRWDVRITGKKSLPTFRYPFPLPAPAQAVKWSVDAGNGWATVRLRINGQAFLVRLSASHKYARAAQAIRDSVTSGLPMGEVSLLLRDNQPWAAVTCYLPRCPKGTIDPARTLAVKTGGGDLFRAIVEGQERIWTLHADDLLPRVERWDEKRQRLSDDRKFERRHGQNRERYQGMMEDRVRRHHDWLKVQLHRRSRELVEFARRNRCGRIEIDAGEKPPGLPWSRLLEMIRQKAVEYDMVVRVGDEAQDASADVAIAPVV